ncbi:MAG: hypothetical protein ABIA93_06520 [Candidatus Woesearchaeota archaeon]
MKLIGFLLFVLLVPVVLAMPRMDSISDQVIEIGEGFKAIHLNDYVIRAEPDAKWGVDGMHDLIVRINKDNITTIDYPKYPPWVGSEKLRFFLVDSTGEDECYVKFTVVDQGWVPAPYVGPNGPQHPGTCSISTGHGLLVDTDCDKTPDDADDCPLVENPDQSDVDRDGVGDACDLVFSSVSYQNEISGGRSVVASYELKNNLGFPANNVRVGISIPDSGLQQIMAVGFLEPGSSYSGEITLRIPSCFPSGTYHLVLTADFLAADAPAQVWREQPLNVMEGTCSQEENRTTLIDVYEIQDVRVGETARYPITITNKESRGRQYTIEVEGIDFGTVSFEPGTVLVVPQGASQTVVLEITPLADASGNHVFYLTVFSDGFQEKIILTTRVEPGIPISEVKMVIFEYIILLLLIVGVLILVLKHRERLNKRIR